MMQTEIRIRELDAQQLEAVIIDAIRKHERQKAIHAEEEFSYNMSRAAEILGISLNTLKKRIHLGLIRQRSDKKISKAEIDRYRSMR